MYKKYTELFGVPEGYVRKLLLIMRLTTFIIIASLMQVSASTFSQTVTLKAKNIPLSQIIKEICAQTDYEFLYNKDMLKNTKLISIDVNNASLSEVLKQCLADQPLSYSIENKVVLLEVKKNKGIIDKISDYFSRIDMHGIVIDDKGQPIPGANIRVKNAKVSTITDEKGNFTLKNIDENATIIITFIGYDSKEVFASKDLATIELKLATSKLDEVLVQAYGKTTQRLSTSNISSITAQQIENKPVTNALLALQGEVPGLVINQNSGFSNSGIGVQLRGLNSISGANEPLYVIDGIPFDSQLPPQINTVGGTSTPFGAGGGTKNAQAGNPFNFLNPQDIESISVLKDADATSIYGSRAANGAILITTKKAVAGENKIDVNLQQGFSEYPYFIKMMNTKDYLQMRKDAFKNDGLPLPSLQNDPNDVNYDLNGIWDENKFTDWQRRLLNGKSNYQNFGVTLTGGNTLSQYLLSGTYHKETNIFDRSDLNDQKGALHLTLNHGSKNQRFKAQFSAMMMLDMNRLPTDAISYRALRLAPNAPDIFNADGTLNWALDSNGKATWENPFSVFENKAYSKVLNLQNSLLISYSITKGLILKSQFGYNRLDLNEWKATYLSSFAPQDRPYSKPSAIFNNARNEGYKIEPQLTYTQVIGKAVLDVLGGLNLEHRDQTQQRINGQNYSNELQLANLQSAGSVTMGGSSILEYNYASLFARANYNYGDKYLVSLNIRKDGSSRFGSNNLFHTFWSLAGGWIFSEEESVKNNLRWLSFGKFRGSYGITGMDNMGDYQFLNLYSTYSAGIPYQGVVALQTSGIPNPSLQWEETKKLDLQLSLGFFNNRILFDATYFRNRTSNQLLANTLPLITGFTRVTKNLDATVQNSGWELELTSNNIFDSKFRWTTKVNLSFVNNKLIKFDDLDKSLYANTYKVGYPITGSFIYKYAGINNQTGLYEFVKADGSRTSIPDFFTDRLLFTDMLTKVSGGLSNIFTFNRFSLSFLLQFAKRDVNGFTGLQPGQMNNQPEYLLDYWKSPGDNTTYQKVSTLYEDAYNASEYAALSDFGKMSIYYARFKNVSFTYNLSDKYVHRLGLRNASIFINGQNLGTFTNYKYSDPENANGYNASLPPLRTYSLGVRIGL